MVRTGSPFHHGCASFRLRHAITATKRHSNRQLLVVKVEVFFCRLAVSFTMEPEARAPRHGYEPVIACSRTTCPHAVAATRAFRPFALPTAHAYWSPASFTASAVGSVIFIAGIGFSHSLVGRVIVALHRFSVRAIPIPASW
mmetsp:Transcript_7372/g.20172  ORF Transcript_7372/g.20172 Transcript_7372/m.20172 type:complete len:142 (+) Transcript_7372:739-1164(+)